MAFCYFLANTFLSDAGATTQVTDLTIGYGDSLATWRLGIEQDQKRVGAGRPPSSKAAWSWLANSYSNQLADQARLQAVISQQSASQKLPESRADRDKRLAFEQRLSASENSH